MLNLPMGSDWIQPRFSIDYIPTGMIKKTEVARDIVDKINAEFPEGMKGLSFLRSPGRGKGEVDDSAILTSMLSKK